MDSFLGGEKHPVFLILSTEILYLYGFSKDVWAETPQTAFRLQSHVTLSTIRWGTWAAESLRPWHPFFYEAKFTRFAGVTSSLVAGISCRGAQCFVLYFLIPSERFLSTLATSFAGRPVVNS